MAAKPTYEQLESKGRELEQGETALKRAMEALIDSEKRSFEERELFLNEMGRMPKPYQKDNLEKGLSKALDD